MPCNTEETVNADFYYFLAFKEAYPLSFAITYCVKVVMNTSKYPLKHNPNCQKYFQRFPDVPLELNSFIEAWKGILESPALDHIDLTLCLQRVSKNLNNLPQNAQQNILGFLESPQGLDLWLDKAEEQMGHFDPEALARSIWSFAELNICPTQSFLKTWCSRALSQMEGFSVWDVANSLFAFVKLRLHPGKDLMEKIIENAEADMNSFNVEDISIYAWSVGHLSGLLPLSAMEAMQERAERIFYDFNPRHLRHYISGITMISAASNVQPTKYHMKTFAQRLLKTKDDHPATLSVIDIAARLFKFEDLYQDIQGINAEGSGWTQKLRRLFADVSGTTIEPPSYDPTFKINTNIAFNCKDKRFVLKANGPRRFFQDFNGNLVTNGQTGLQLALVHNQYPDARILSLSYAHEGKMLEEFGEDLSRLTDKFIEASPGIYHSAIEDGHFLFKPDCASLSPL